MFPNITVPSEMTICQLTPYAMSPQPPLLVDRNKLDSRISTTVNWAKLIADSCSVPEIT